MLFFAAVTLGIFDFCKTTEFLLKSLTNKERFTEKPLLSLSRSDNSSLEDTLKRTQLMRITQMWTPTMEAHD